MNSATDHSTRRLVKGDVVRVVWKDAVEGVVQMDLTNLGRTQLRNIITSIISTTGVYLKVANGYLILSEVLQEDSNGRPLYEKQAAGKWLAIPLGVISQVSHVGRFVDSLANNTKRRRTIFNQLRFLPRTRRLPTGELSRTLYLA